MVSIIIIHNKRRVVFATQMAAYDCIAMAAMPVERLLAQWRTATR
jgi:hypothetical protein